MKKFILLCLLAMPGLAFGAAAPRNLVNTESPVSARCVSADGTTYESCGGSITEADGAIVDGVDSGIRATVQDLTNSNPLAVSIVDGDGSQITSFGGGTQYQQGTAATDTDTFTMAGCVRADTAAVATGVADGDRARCIVDATGRLWVNTGTVTVTGTVAATQSGTWNINNVSGTVSLPTGAATAANQSTVIGHVDGVEGLLTTIDGDTGTIAGAVKTTGNAAGATDTGVPPLAVRDDGLATLADAEGDYVPLRVDANGALWINLSTALSSSIDSITTRENTGANNNAKINCTNNAFLNMTTATTTQIVALSGSTHIYVCSFSIVLGGSVATNVKFVSGTGTNCATSQEDRSANLALDPTSRPGIARGSGEGMIIKTGAAGDALCVTSSAAGTPLAIDISYSQF